MEKVTSDTRHIIHIQTQDTATIKSLSDLGYFIFSHILISASYIFVRLARTRIK